MGDYRDFKTKKQREKEAKGKDGLAKLARRDGTKGAGYWWKAEDSLEKRVFDVIDHLRTQQQTRIQANIRHLQMYGDMHQLSMRRGRMMTQASPVDPSGKVTCNVIRMSIDTLTAKICKNRPKATFVTSGGNWDERQRGKLLDKFIQGVFYTAKMQQIARECFTDACIMDIGAVKFYRAYGQICAERVIPTELFVDDIDGTYGTPRCLYQVKSVPREVLIELYPKHELAILNAATTKDPLSGGPMFTALSLADFVEVVEAWHLPSSPDAGDGKHIISVSNQVLNPEDTEWKRPRFPFAFFRWSKRRQGFYGQGVAEQLTGDQIYLNKLLRTMSQALHLTAVPRVWIEEGSGVDKNHINNDIGAIGFYAGRPPIFQVQSGVPPELFQEIERAKARAFERVGVSQLSVASKKPAGLNSGQALRDFNDIESDRFVTAGQDYEQFHLDATEVAIDEAEEEARENSGFEVTLTGKMGGERIRWKDVNLDRDAYVMKMFPSSSLPQTPAARQEQIAEWQAKGWIDQTEARRLMDMPDLDNSNNILFAGQEDIEATCQAMLDGEDYIPPEPTQNLQYGIDYMTSQRFRAKRLKAPAQVLRNLQEWMDAAKDLLQAAAPPAPMSPPAPGGPVMPGMGGGPMPGSAPPGGPPMGMPG